MKTKRPIRACFNLLLTPVAGEVASMRNKTIERIMSDKGIA